MIKKLLYYIKKIFKIKNTSKNSFYFSTINLNEKNLLFYLKTTISKIFSNKHIEARSIMPHKRHPERQLVNFSAGPSAQPLDVLFKAQRDLIDYEATETSVLELSHRSAAFSKIMHNTESLARELL
jgi:hypothetical protein